MPQSTSTPVEISERSAVALTDGEPVEVACLAGHLWITERGNPSDTVLSAGEAAVFDHPYEVIISALGGPARAQITEHLPLAVAA